MSKRFLIILLACVAIFFGIIFVSKREANAPNSGGGDSNQLTNHVIGGGKKGVTLIEYGDFQCPACYGYEPTMREIREKYKDDITFQFRHFPLVEIHQNALSASRAAEAAGLQGKFWEMHDMLYEAQDPNGKSGWSGSPNPTTFFEDFAAQLSLDVEKFKTDFRSDQTNRAVQNDRSEAKKLGFSGTPSFMLDGKKIEEPKNEVEFFSKLIDEAIKAKQVPPSN